MSENTAPTSTTAEADDKSTLDRDPWKEVNDKDFGTVSAEDLQATIPKVTNLKAAYKALLAADEEAFQRKVAEENKWYDAETADLAARPGDPSPINAEAADVLRRRYADKRDVAIRNHRQALIALNADTRAEMVRQLHDHAKRAATSLAILDGTARKLLSIQGIGSQRRFNIHKQYKNAGAAQLETLSQIAVARGDLELGSVVASLNDAMPRNRRTFSSEKFAERLVGPMYHAIIDASRAINQTYLNVVSREREYTSGKSSPMAKISRGLRDTATQNAINPKPLPKLK